MVTEADIHAAIDREVEFRLTVNWNDADSCFELRDLVCDLEFSDEALALINDQVGAMIQGLNLAVDLLVFEVIL